MDKPLVSRAELDAIVMDLHNKAHSTPNPLEIGQMTLAVLKVRQLYEQRLAELDEAGEWIPITEYGYDEHLNMGPGKPSKWQRVTVRGRMITLDCGDTGRHAALLPEGMGVCQRASKKGGGNDTST